MSSLPPKARATGTPIAATRTALTSVPIAIIIKTAKMTRGTITSDCTSRGRPSSTPATSPAASSQTMLTTVTSEAA
ncbi:MAG: hypothetical protein OHK0018_06330 [Erythrobacter tepidarius]